MSNYGIWIIFHKMQNQIKHLRKLNMKILIFLNTLNIIIFSWSADSAVLSITCKDNFIAAGLYTPKIIAFDPRESEKRLFELSPHKRSIIELCLVQDYYLISLSEDKTLSVWDLRTQSTVKSMYLAKVKKNFENYYL